MAKEQMLTVHEQMMLDQKRRNAKIEEVVKQVLDKDLQGYYDWMGINSLLLIQILRKLDNG
uniref:Uncharacterized protein n=1 Tax=viral metagenome TaxID=1070528 RepID=A0A6H1ZSW9_9ZZZZ